MLAKEKQLLAWIAEQFYCNGVSQVEIAKKLRSSRATVCRQLKRAVDEGIVRFEITVPMQNNTVLERELEGIFGLRRACVADLGESGKSGNFDVIGRAGAVFLHEMLKDGDVVGLSGGSSVNAVVDKLQPEDCDKKIEVLQLYGLLPEQFPRKSSFFAAEHMASKFGCNWSPMLLPAIADSVQSLEILTSSVSYQNLVKKFAGINVALSGIGSLVGDKPDSELYRIGYIKNEDLQELRARNAVAVILSHVIDSKGQPVASPVGERVISMPLQQLKSVEFSVGVSSGVGKAPAILAALRGGWFNHLVTDSQTAVALIQLASKTPTKQYKETVKK